MLCALLACLQVAEYRMRLLTGLKQYYKKKYEEGAVALNTPQALDAVFAEVRASRYRRSFTLSNELDAAAIDAQLKDGVLRLRIPKVAEAQPRRIEVRVG